MRSIMSRYVSAIGTAALLAFGAGSASVLAQYDEQQWWNPGDWFDEQPAYNLFTDDYWEDRTYGTDWGDEQMLGDGWMYDDSAWGYDEDFWGDDWGYEGAQDDFGTDEFGTDDTVGSDTFGSDTFGTDDFGTNEFGTDEFGTDEFGTDEFGLDE